MPKCFKRSLLEYLMAPELDPKDLAEVTKQLPDISVTELASTIIELCLVIHVTIFSDCITARRINIKRNR